MMKEAMREKHNGSNRVDRSKFLIGTYYLMPYAQTEEHIKQLVEANIDFIVAEPRNERLLDMLHKYGIGIFPKGIIPEEQTHLIEDIPTVEMYEKCAAEYVDHPAIWGPFVTDEPSSVQFPLYGKLIEKLKELFPGQTPHFNLFGNCYLDWATTDFDAVKRTGVDNYKALIDRYDEHIGLDYISFDQYVYDMTVTPLLESFYIISNKCRATGRDLWFTGQCNNQDIKHIVTENMLRYQGYVALAFGCKSLTWGCWTKGWWEMNVIDEYGNTTEQFEKLCKVNKELKETAKVYMEYESKSTHLLGFDGTPYASYINDKNGSIFELKSENNIDLGDFKSVTIENGCAVVGYFEKNNGKCALMVADHSDPRDLGEVIAKVTFKTDKKVKALYNGTPMEIKSNGDEYSFMISHSCGVFITLE